MKHPYLPVILLVLLTAFLISCRPTRTGEGLPPSLRRDATARRLAYLLEDRELTAEERFSVMEKLIGLYRGAGEGDALVLRLQAYLRTWPDDPYAAWYLLAQAAHYESVGARPLADDLYRRILRTTRDMDFQDRSVHLLCLEKLLEYTPPGDEEVRLREELIERFTDRVDPGREYYYLARARERAGDFEEAISDYRRFLRYPDARIPGEPKAASETRRKIAFHDSDKSWAVRDLDDLVTAVKWAISSRSITRLLRYQADDFFMMSWGQEDTDSFTHIPMDLQPFLKSSVGYRRDLEPFSNEREAFLRTWGWSYRIRIWYLYFRKIDYPADPEWHGRWEWTGIYFGERL